MTATSRSTTLYAASAGPISSGRSRLAMIRSTHSMSVRECIPTRVSSRMTAGFPMTFTNVRATLK